MKRLTHGYVSPQRDEEIVDADFVEVQPEYPTPAAPTLGDWWRGKSGVTRKLIAAFAAVAITVVALVALGMVSVERRDTAAVAQYSPAVTALGARLLVEGVRPEADLVIDSGDPAGQATQHQIGDLLCPLVADGWTLSPSVGDSKVSDGITSRNVTYRLERGSEQPTTISTVRYEKDGHRTIELLREFRASGRMFKGLKAWQPVNEIFSQDMLECRALAELTQ